MNQQLNRLEWDEALFLAIEAYDITRSDAQSIVEAKEHLADQMFAQNVSPADAAKRFAAD